ncbi:MAG: RNase A-like domain-containing protein [Terriglobales bacterium]|jgi:filamentous hemagglutinin
MTRIFPVRSVTVQIVFALGMWGLISCQPPAATNGAAAALSGSITARVEAHPTNGPVRDLSRDEAAGGHILRKHVGQTDDELRERLQREPRITGASTYTDRPTAEHAVGAAIAASQDRIQRWLSRTGGHPNLVLDYDSAAPIGRTISRDRGESQSRPCSHALVVLKYAGPDEYYVLTSYPECRS